MVGDELQVWGVLDMGWRVVGCGHRVPSEHRWVSGCVGLGSGVYRGVQGTGCMRGMGTGLQGAMAGWRAGQVGCRVLGAGFGVRVHNARGKVQDRGARCKTKHAGCTQQGLGCREWDCS